MAVAVEEELELPGLPLMELVGVVYHDGKPWALYLCVSRAEGSLLFL